MYQLFSIVLCVLSLFFVPACIKTYNLVPPETPQGVNKKDSRQITKEFVRSVKVYDEWETKAMFDVLWVSDDVMRSYVDLYCDRRGTLDKNKMLESENKVTRNDITFYVLADVRDKLHPLLNENLASWTMRLEFGDTKVVPHQKGIKEVELSSEMQSFFGCRYRNIKFKTAYLVTFPKFDPSGKPYITPGKPFRMIISSVAKECVLGWQGGEPVLIRCMRKENNRKLIKDEDYYWI